FGAVAGAAVNALEVANGADANIDVFGKVRDRSVLARVADHVRQLPVIRLIGMLFTLTGTLLFHVATALAILRPSAVQKIAAHAFKQFVVKLIGDRGAIDGGFALKFAVAARARFTKRIGRKVHEGQNAGLEFAVQ